MSALPLAAIRDLLGIARAMYGSRKRQGVSDPELRELEDIGRKLKTALELAGKAGPNTVGYRAARAHAEEAASRLMKMITLDMRLAPTVEAAVVRMRRLDPLPNAREERRVATRKRS